jgi:hypothetical protein
MLVEYLVAGCSSLGLVGLPLTVACAFAGNGTQENKCLPSTTGIKDHGSDGIFQWRLDRLVNLKTFARKIEQPWDNIRTQAWFVLYELQLGYRALLAELMANKKPLKTITANICKIYERPAVEEYTEKINGKTRLDWRIQYANDTWALFQEQKATAPLPVPPIVIGTGAVAGSTGTAAVLWFASCDWCMFGGGFVIGAIVIGIAAYFTWGTKQAPRNMTTLQEYKYLQGRLASVREKLQTEADEALTTLKGL